MLTSVRFSKEKLIGGVKLVLFSLVIIVCDMASESTEKDEMDVERPSPTFASEMSLGVESTESSCGISQSLEEQSENPYSECSVAESDNQVDVTEPTDCKTCESVDCRDVSFASPMQSCDNLENEAPKREQLSIESNLATDSAKVENSVELESIPMPPAENDAAPVSQTDRIDGDGNVPLADVKPVDDHNTSEVQNDEKGTVAGEVDSSCTSHMAEETQISEFRSSTEVQQTQDLDSMHSVSDNSPSHDEDEGLRSSIDKDNEGSLDAHSEDEDEDGPMLGHHFNEEGRLLDKNNKPFKFAYYEDREKNQQRYQIIGEAITEKVYEMLENRCQLKRLNLPLGVQESEPHSFIFLSKDALTTKDRLLILIHGSGVVRAGQWARRLIINDDLGKGTQIPYIERALSEGFEVIVLNTNLNYWPDGAFEAQPIPENDDPESHGMYVWQNVVVKLSHAQHIAIVAHSYGGIVTTYLLEHDTEEFRKRVFAVAFTDSVHSLGFGADKEVSKFYKKHARNYVTSDLPLGEKVTSYFDFSGDAERVSAGHTKHEWTSYSSLEDVFRFLHTKYLARTSDTSDRCSAV